MVDKILTVVFSRTMTKYSQVHNVSRRCLKTAPTVELNIRHCAFRSKLMPLNVASSHSNPSPGEYLTADPNLEKHDVGVKAARLIKVAFVLVRDAVAAADRLVVVFALVGAI